MTKKIAIIGGGPIGIEAALYGSCAGFEVRVYERGRIAENVRQWGHIGLFTEWKRNRSPLAARLLRERNIELPPPETTSSGDELAAYVARVAALEPLRGCIFPQTEVVSVTRERTLKSDLVDDPRRAQRPFRLMLRGAFGEKIAHADAVIDATGVYQTPNFCGSGGAPCPGEKQNAREIFYHLPDVAGRDRVHFANRHTLVVGSGHSAASTLRSIGELMPTFPDTRVTWAVRRDVPPHGFPYTLTDDDSSPHRQELHRDANELSRHPNVDFRPRSVVEKIERDRQGFRVTLNIAPPNAREHSQEEIESHVFFCDTIAAHVGFRPDETLWSELQVHPHFATDGVFGLSEAILAVNKQAGVGLSTGYAEKKPPEENPNDAGVSAHCVVGDPSLLRHPEPNFYVIGIKSYGRDAGFLMQNGFRQVRDIYQLLGDDASLDLYGDNFD